MEATQRLIGISLVATLFIASSGAEIIVQPGYNHPRDGPQGDTGSPTQNQGAVITQQPQSLSLADEFKRNQVLQQMVENQILQMVHQQQVHQTPPGIVGLPLVPLSLRPRIGGGRILSLPPSGIRGLHMGGHGLTKHPHIFRDANEPQAQEDNEDRTQRPRCVSRSDSGVSSSQVHDVASVASVDGDSVNGADELPEPQALVAEDSPEKLVEPRQISERDDAIVGSPLDRIHYDQPHDLEQHHPMDSSAMSSQFMKTAQVVGQMIDKVASDLTHPKSGYENKDPISSMTHRQDSSRNYQQKSPSNWILPSPSSNKEPMTGQSFNSQRPQNFEWRSMVPAQSSQYPSAKSSGNDRHFQKQPASYPAFNTPANNWLTLARTIFSGPGGYHNHQNPGYNNNNNYGSYQPGYQSYPNRPQNGDYRPYYNRPPPFNYGPSGPTSTATASASSSSGNNNNYYNPYQRSWDANNPYVSYSQVGFPGFTRAVDQFGRAIMIQLPSGMNSIIANPNNMAYYGNSAGQQLPKSYYLA